MLELGAYLRITFGGFEFAIARREKKCANSPGLLLLSCRFFNNVVETNLSVWTGTRSLAGKSRACFYFVAVPQLRGGVSS